MAKCHKHIYSNNKFDILVFSSSFSLYIPLRFFLTYPLVTPLLRTRFPTTFVSWSDIVCMNIIDTFSVSNFAIKSKIPKNSLWRFSITYSCESFYFLYAPWLKSLCQKSFCVMKKISFEAVNCINMIYYYVLLKFSEMKIATSWPYSTFKNTSFVRQSASCNYITFLDDGILFSILQIGISPKGK